MKRIIAGVILFALCLSLCACKRQSDDTDGAFVDTNVSGKEIPVRSAEEAVNGFEAAADVSKTEPSNSTVGKIDADVSKTEPSNSTVGKIDADVADKSESDANSEAKPRYDAGKTAATNDTSSNAREQSSDPEIPASDRSESRPGGLLEGLDIIGVRDSDFFIGRVLSVLPEDKLSFVNYRETIGKTALYTVEVIDEIWTTTAKKGNVVRVAHFEDPEQPYEVGKTYLMSAYAQISNGGTMLLDYGGYTSLLGEDGSLKCLSDMAEKAIGKLGTLDAFLNEPRVKKLLERTPDNIPDCFYKGFGNEISPVYQTEKYGRVNLNVTPIRVTGADGSVIIERGEPEHDRDEVIALVREAVKAEPTVFIESMVYSFDEKIQYSVENAD